MSNKTTKSNKRELPLLAEVKQDNKLDVVVANNSFVFEIVWHLKLIIYNFKQYFRGLIYDFYQHNGDYTCMLTLLFETITNELSIISISNIKIYLSKYYMYKNNQIIVEKCQFLKHYHFIIPYFVIAVNDSSLIVVAIFKKC